MRNQEDALATNHDNGSEREFFQLSQYPGRLLRVEPLINGSVADSLEYYKKQIQLAQELGEKYGVATPDFDLQIDENARGEVLLMLSVEEIEFVRLPELKRRGELPETLFDDIDIFYSSLINSIVDAYRARNPFFADFSNDQWRYGHRANQIEPNCIWLLDVGKDSFIYPGSDVYDSMAYNWAYEEALKQFAEALKEAEEFFEARSNLTESWQALERAREIKRNGI